MSAPSSRSERRKVTVIGKEFKDVKYRPQFALGILCESEQEQCALFARLGKVLPGKEVKVLVI